MSIRKDKQLNDNLIKDYLKTRLKSYNDVNNKSSNNQHVKIKLYSDIQENIKVKDIPKYDTHSILQDNYTNNDIKLINKEEYSDFKKTIKTNPIDSIMRSFNEEIKREVLDKTFNLNIIDDEKKLNKVKIDESNNFFSDFIKDKVNDINLDRDVNLYRKILQDKENFIPTKDQLGNCKGFCMICKLECSGYIPITSKYEDSDNINSSQCIKCRCGSSGHFNINNDRIFSQNYISKINSEMNKSHIVYNNIILIIEEFSPSKSDQKSFFSLLKDAGYEIINLRNISNTEISDIQMRYKKYNLKNNENDESKLNDYIDIYRLFKDETYDSIFREDNNQININSKKIIKEFNKNELIKTYKSIVDNDLNKNFNTISTNNEKENRKYKVICLFLNPLLINSQKSIHEYFSQYKSQISCLIPKEYKLIYNSNDNYTSLNDSIFFFPEIFILKESILLMIEKTSITNINDFTNNNSKRILGSFNSYFNSKEEEENKKIENNIQSDEMIINQDYMRILSNIEDQFLVDSVGISKKCHGTIKNLYSKLSYFGKNNKINDVLNDLKFIIEKYKLYVKNKLSFYLISKIGLIPTIPIQNNQLNLEIVPFTNPIEVDIINNFIFDNEIKYTRSLLIIRPNIVKLGISDIIINLLKRNNFLIISRKEICLTKYEALFLFNFEKINKLYKEFYISYMTESHCIALVIGKFGCIESLANLFNSSILSEEDIFSKSFTNSILQKVLLRNENETNNNNNLNVISSQNIGSIYKSFIQIINYEKLFYEINYEEINNQKKNKVFLKTETLYNQINEKKEEFINFVKSFNIFIYKSSIESDKMNHVRIMNIDGKEERKESSYSNEYEINFFFPELNEMQEAILFLKPDLNKETIDLIIVVLTRMGFKIEENEYFEISKEEFELLFKRYKNIINSDYYTVLENKFYLNKKELQLLKVLKPGGYNELYSLLNENIINFFDTVNVDKHNSHSYSKVNMLIESKIKVLIENTYLITSSIDIEFIYNKLFMKYRNIEGGSIIKNPYNILNILNYSLKSTLSDELYKKSKLDEYENIKQDENKSNKKNSNSLIMKYLKFFHFDDLTKINEKFLDLISDYILSKWEFEGKILKIDKRTNIVRGLINKDVSLLNNIDQKYNELITKNDYSSFQLINFNDDIFNIQLEFLVESENIGFYEIRIPIFKYELEFSKFEINSFEFEMKNRFIFSNIEFYLEMKGKNSEILLESEELYIMLTNSENLLTFINNNLHVNDNIKKEIYNTLTYLIIKKWKCEEMVGNDNQVLYNNLKEINFLLENVSFIEDSNNQLYLKYVVSTIIENLKKRIFYKTIFESNKLYYKTCSLSGVEANPEVYNYRIKPDEISMDITRIYEVESFSGFGFFEIVSQDVIKYREAEIKYLKKFDNNQNSMPGYLWGKKLGRLSANLMELQFNEMENSGPLIYSKEKLKGIINKNNYYDYSKELYIKIQVYIKDFFKQNSIYTFSDNEISLFDSKIDKIINSESFYLSRQSNNLTLSPIRLVQENVRVGKKKDYMKKVDIFKFEDNRSNMNVNGLDPKMEINFHEYLKNIQKLEENDIFDLLKKTINIVNLSYEITSKYKLYAIFMWLIRVSYNKINRKSSLFNNNEEEYDNMIMSLIEGFHSEYKLEEGNLSKSDSEMNIYKMEYILHGLLELKYIIKDILDYRSQVQIIDKRINYLITQRINIKEQIELDKYKNKMIKLISNMELNVEIIFYEIIDYDIYFKPTNNEQKLYERVPLSRYYIPMNFGERIVENPIDYRHEKKIALPMVMNQKMINIYLDNIKNREKSPSKGKDDKSKIKNSKMFGELNKNSTLTVFKNYLRETNSKKEYFIDLEIPSYKKNN